MFFSLPSLPPLADLQSVVGAARGQKIFDALHATQSE